MSPFAFYRGDIAACKGDIGDIGPKTDYFAKGTLGDIAQE
jgi:hypothetical protein